MSETMRMWIEILFNLSYLVVVWGLIIMMIKKLPEIIPQKRQLASLFIWAFGMLALGDTGHVGFRVVAYALGSLEAKPVILGVPVSLVGLGALSTAVTVTLFYMLMLLIWRARFEKQLGWFGWFLLVCGGARLVVMAFPQNEWGNLVAPYNWSLLRNSFLILQGLGVLYLILRDAGKFDDRPFLWIGVMIALSFAFYAPVILWVHLVPNLGMLMIPKTCAYVAIAVIAYLDLFKPPAIVGRA